MAVEFVDQSVAHDANVTVPNGVQAGDFLLCTDVQTTETVQQNPMPLVIPSGFTSLYSLLFVANSDEYGRLAISGRIAVGDESGQTVTGMNWVFDNKSMRMFVFRGNVPIKEFAAQAFQRTNTLAAAGDYSRSVPSGSGSPPLIPFSLYHARLKDNLEDHSLSSTPDFSAPAAPGFDLSSAHTWCLGMNMNVTTQDVSSQITKPLVNGGAVNHVTGYIELQ